MKVLGWLIGIIAAWAVRMNRDVPIRRRTWKSKPYHRHRWSSTLTLRTSKANKVVNIEKDVSDMKDILNKWLVPKQVAVAE